VNDKANDETGKMTVEARAKRLFDESVAAQDGATQSRVNRGRQAALREIRGRRPGWQTLVPATGIAAAIAVAVLVVNRGPDVESLDAPLTDLEILLDEDSLEMLEDLEFYSWMEFAEAETAAVPENHVG